MTEAEWLACGDLLVMLPFVGRSGQGSGRKYRLFAVACARDGLAGGGNPEEEALPPEYRFETAILEAEAFADGQGELKNPGHFNVALRLCDEITDKDVAYSALGFDAASGNWLEDPKAVVPRYVETYRTHPAHFVRDLIGYPFRDVRLDPLWVTPTVLSLAQATYECRHLPAGHLDAGHLAVLADALEEAGCSEDAILAHLRSPGPHVRGCWAVDLLLGKS